MLSCERPVDDLRGWVQLLEQDAVAAAVGVIDQGPVHARFERILNGGIHFPGQELVQAQAPVVAVGGIVLPIPEVHHPRHALDVRVNVQLPGWRSSLRGPPRRGRKRAVG